MRNDSQRMAVLDEIDCTILAELQERDPGQAPGWEGRSPPLGIQIGEIPVDEDRAEVVAQRQVGIALREGGAGDTSGLCGDRRRRRLAVK